MSDLEKLTINVTLVDLGKIDVLVEEGFYQNRSDFIRTAIRNEIAQHKRKIEDITIAKSWSLGVVTHSKNDLEELLSADKMVQITVIGALRLDPQITPELAERTIASVRVRGKMFMADDVLARLEELGRIL